MSKFAQGQVICLKSDRTVTGAIVGIIEDYPETRYQVFTALGMQTYYETQIEGQNTEDELERVDAVRFHAGLTASLIRNPSISSLYSLNTAKIDFIRPVLKFIRSDRPRLLIADGVGVGKTIEAASCLFDKVFFLLSGDNTFRQVVQRCLKNRKEEGVMGKYVNLEQIVNYVFESEFDEQPTPETREYKRNSRYENTRDQLTQILNALDFHVDLIKDKKQGITGKGMYIFPREDGPFIEWLISEFSTENGKAIKAGNFTKCHKLVLRKMIDGLITILEHLEVPEEIVKMQLDIMEQKTLIYISYQAHTMWNRLYRSLYSIGNMMEISTSFLSYDEQRDYWVQFSNDLDAFLKQKESEYMAKERICKKEALEDAPRLTKEDVEFSMRSHAIINELEKNEEFMALKSEYIDMFLQSNKKTAQIRKKNEKRKKEIIDRQYEIFHEITKEHPFNVEQMTTLEKFMAVYNDKRFTLTYVQEEEQWALLETDKFYKTERIWQARHPSGEVLEEIYLEDFL